MNAIIGLSQLVLRTDLDAIRELVVDDNAQARHPVTVSRGLRLRHDKGGIRGIGVPDSILQRSGKLDDEWSVRCGHREIGAKIIGVHAAGVLLSEIAPPLW